MARFWRISAVMTALCVALAVTAGAAVAKSSPGKSAKPRPTAGQLDPSFGQGGKIAVSIPKSENEPPVEMATAPSGKTYVLDESLLLAFGANGKPDRGFGQNGRLQVAAATGLTTKVADLTVDSEGRILVTGSFEPMPGAVNYFLPKGSEATAFSTKLTFSDAFVVRYLPTGERDPSFGSGGEIDATLEVPAPQPPVGYPGQSLHYEQPVVQAARIAVVEGVQPVIGGSYTYSGGCYLIGVPASAFAARLDPAGPGTQTLPATGYTNLPGYDTRVAALVPAPGGLGVLSENDGGGCSRPGAETTPSQLTTSAALVPGLDPSRPVLSNLLDDALAVDGSGRMLVAEGPVDFSSANSWKLVRLLPNGDYDTSFGEAGGMPLLGFGTEPVESIVTDARSRVLIGGGSDRFRVVRIGTKAKIDHSFGNHGWAEAGFGRATNAHLSALTIDAKGRIIAAGYVTGSSLKTGQGIGLVRFLPGG